VDIERIGFDSGGPGNERMHELVRQHRQVMSQQYRKGVVAASHQTVFRRRADSMLIGSSSIHRDG
jgi:hypothetical protein